MKIRSLLLSLAVLTAGAVVYAVQDGMPMPEPSAEHKHLTKMVGTWNAAMDMGTPEPLMGTMTYEAGPGGFTVLGHFTADMSAIGMGKFEGRAIDGFDPVTKKYVGVWIDSWTPAPMFSEGTFDEKTKTLTMHGDMDDQMSGKRIKHKLATTWTSDNEMNFVVSAPGADGKDEKKFSIKYTRR